MKVKPLPSFLFSRMRIVFFLAGLILHSQALLGQEYFFKSLTVNNGLSQNDVSAICQDSFGFIWIGTYDGLNKFDGFTLKSFHKITSDENSLPGNRVTVLREDHQKRLWIGIEGGEIAYYSLIKEQFVRVPTPKRTTSIYDILVTDSNEVYAATDKGVLKLHDGDKLEFLSIAVSQGLNVRAAKQTIDGSIVFAGLDGVFVFRNELMKEISNPENKQIISLGFDSRGNLLGGGYDGLYRIILDSGLHKINFSKKEFRGERVHSILTDLTGNTWLGTDSQGLIQLNERYEITHIIRATPLEERGLLSNTVLDLFCDKNNNLWVGNRQGLCYTCLNNVGFGSLNLNNLTRPNVRSILLNGYQAFLGVNNQGLFQYDLIENQAIRLLSDQINHVNSISRIGQSVYFCTNSGVFAKSSSSPLKKIEVQWSYDNTSLPTNITSIARDSFSRSYLGTHSGVVVWENAHAEWIWKKEPALNVLEGIRVFRLWFDSDYNRLLIGTIARGLMAINFNKDGSIGSLDEISLMGISSTPVEHTSVWAYHQSKNGSIWIGTDAGLFTGLADSKNLSQVNVDGVIDKKIMRILEDPDGKLWLSNTQGLISFDPESEAFRKYTYNDGLLSSTLTEGAAIDSLGRLYFGTSTGVNFVNPEQPMTNPYHAEVMISKFSVHNQQVVPGEEVFGSIILNENINHVKELTLNHLQNNFTFEFTGTNFVNVEEDQFKYKLEGYDREWLYTGQDNRFVSYSNLSPGSYCINLDVANQNGEWTNQPLKIDIEILPAPWKTPFAYILYMLAVMAIAGGFIYFWYNRQRLNHQITLDRMVIQRDQELREIQLRFFTDVAHEFKTPLSLIIAPLNDLMSRDLSGQMKNTVYQIVSRNIKRMNYLISQLLDFGKISEGANVLKPTYQDISECILEISEAFQWQVQKEQIDFQLHLKECNGYFDRDVIEKAMYNVLSNAFKYTPKNGKISIDLSIGGTVVLIKISDSGSGIPDEHKEQVFDRFFHDRDRASSGIGLHLTSILIQAHGGAISVSDSEFGGACFTITLPKETKQQDSVKIAERNEEHMLMDVEEENQDMQVDEETETILVVEDDHDLRNYLKIYLQSEFVVLEAKNGEEGVELAKAKSPNIIISDVMMPVMDGIKMCEILKKDNATSHIPILLLTAKTGKEYEKKGLGAGAWDYIPKPFDSEALLKKVQNIIETRNKFKSYLSTHNINIDVKAHYTSFDQQFITNVSRIIEENIQNETFTVSELADEVGLSRMHLHRKLKTLVGESAKSIITRVKVKYAADMFDQGCDRIQEAMDAVGMTSYANFNNNFKRVMNMTATDYIASLKDKRNSD
ncbi:MAG: response regulator [Cyclobacteriaceae bacterium]